MTSAVEAARAPVVGPARTLDRWDPEDGAQWEAGAKRHAARNLWISIPNLLCAFAVWSYWGMLIKFIQKVHFARPEYFDFTFLNGGQSYDVKGYQALMFTLPAVAGLAGATLRIPNSFMIAISGGRNVKFMTTLLLILPALGAGIALQDPNVSFSTLIVLAALSGVGGGAFASSMSNISFFFPKKVQGLSLGLNAGLGNAGVSVMQFLLPWIITFGAFGALGGGAYEITSQGETERVWIQNAGLVWVPVLVLCAAAAFFGMNNLPQHRCGGTAVAVGKYLWLTLLGYAAVALGVVLLVVPWGGFPELLKIFLILVVVVVATLLAMRYATPAETKQNLRGQFAIFRNKHNWVMTWLYIMTFGSFIGFSFAFPKLIDDVFGFVRVDAGGGALPGPVKNPSAPDSALYIWLGAGVGALIRPVGGWLSDKWGGARVTHWDTIVMIAATVGAGWCVSAAIGSPTPERYFVPFLLLFILLFATTGIGNGSTFRMIPMIFSKEQAGPVLGWTSAIAAYGAYLIPNVFAAQIKAGTPQVALYGFAVYYLSCLLVNWWYYARKNAEIRC